VHPQRFDWVGYDRCIRNPVLQYNPPPVQARAHKPRRRRLSHQTVASGQAATVSQS
jgi:hypothetical protein